MVKDHSYRHRKLGWEGEGNSTSCGALVGMGNNSVGPP